MNDFITKHLNRQRAATANIDNHFGLHPVLDYLIGEKFLDFLEAAKKLKCRRDTLRGHERSERSHTYTLCDCDQTVNGNDQLGGRFWRLITRGE